MDTKRILIKPATIKAYFSREKKRKADGKTKGLMHQKGAKVMSGFLGSYRAVDSSRPYEKDRARL